MRWLEGDAAGVPAPILPLVTADLAGLPGAADPVTATGRAFRQVLRAPSAAGPSTAGLVDVGVVEVELQRDLSSTGCLDRTLLRIATRIASTAPPARVSVAPASVTRSGRACPLGYRSAAGWDRVCHHVAQDGAARRSSGTELVLSDAWP